MNHPCQYSPEVLDILRTLVAPGDHVHDPFAGPGVRLGKLCDEIGATFSGGDIEEWPGRDYRVQVLNATWQGSYPPFQYNIEDYLLVTSPVYQNKRCADYANGPTPDTKTKGRRDYGIALGRALHPNNLARTTGRKNREEDYWYLHGLAVRWWPNRVIVNVDEPIHHRWLHLLIGRGYDIKEIIPAYTRRYGGLDNADKRAEHEVVIVGVRP